MTLFNELCVMFVPGILVWHIMFIFFLQDSRFQKYRFRKSLEALYESAYDSFDIIHKNRKFNVEVDRKKVNDTYSYYEIYVNGSLAATYHQLQHTYLNSYFFREENKRHRDEVESIIRATCRVLKDKEKPKKVKNDGYNEYSYFN